MNIINPINTNHNISFVCRFSDPTTAIIFELFNEVTKVYSIVANTYTMYGGILTLNFDLVVENNAKYQIKVTEGITIIYRGKLFATNQNTQDYKLTNDLYFYE